MAKLVIKGSQQLNLLLNFTKHLRAPHRRKAFVITAVSMNIQMSTCPECAHAFCSS